jgi:hypothetical protein
MSHQTPYILYKDKFFYCCPDKHLPFIVIVGRSQVQFLVKSLDFSFDLILPAALMALGSTKPLTEMSTRNLPGGKGRLAHKADDLTAICEPIV